MTLPVEWLVRGILYNKDSETLSNTKVWAKDITNFQGNETDITDANGKFVINMRLIADNGSTCRVSATSGSQFASYDFELRYQFYIV